MDIEELPICLTCTRTDEVAKRIRAVSAAISAVLCTHHRVAVNA